MKYLAIVERTANGFRGYAHRLAGCEVLAATEKEAEASIIAAVKVHPDALKANGAHNGEIEVIVAVEAVPPVQPRDGTDGIDNGIRKQFRPEDLEWVLTFDREKELAEGLSGEDLLRELEQEERRLPGGKEG